MTVVGVHTLLLGLFCPMELHHSLFLSEFNFFNLFFLLQPQVVKCRLTHSVCNSAMCMIVEKKKFKIPFLLGQETSREG